MERPEPHAQAMHDWLATVSRAQSNAAQHFDPQRALESMTVGFGPWKALVVSQMEFITLASRRAQAYMGVPQRLARCRTRDALLEEQMRFWQTAFEQYQDSSARVVQAWSEALGAPNPVQGLSFPARPGPADASGPSLIQLPVAGRKPQAVAQTRRDVLKTT